MKSQQLPLYKGDHSRARQTVVVFLILGGLSVFNFSLSSIVVSKRTINIGSRRITASTAATLPRSPTINNHAPAAPRLRLGQPAAEGTTGTIASNPSTLSQSRQEEEVELQVHQHELQDGELAPHLLKQQQQEEEMKQQSPQDDEQLVEPQDQSLQAPPEDPAEQQPADPVLPEPVKPKQPPQSVAAEQSAQTQRRLEFVHIPKTGGTAIENAAWKSKPKVRWGCYHYNQNRPPAKRRFLNVPYWHLPPTMYRRDSIDANATTSTEVPPAVLAEFDPHGPSPYMNASLFTVVRNPYARAVSEYLFYHREVRRFQLEKYNDVGKLNSWLSDAMKGMDRALQPATASSSSNYTIDTAGHWNKPLEMTKSFIRPYFQSLGHFIPQYDFVYDTDQALGDDGGLPPPPTQKVIEHVLHFENLHEEFAALMAQYNMSVVLPDPHKKDPIATSDNKPQKEIKPSIVGVANLTDSTKRLIEKVYARDFAAFGYEMDGIVK